MTKILVVGDSPSLDTGFSRVIEKINNEFINKGYEIKQIGWCHLEGVKDFPYEIFPCGEKNDPYAVNQFNKVVEEYKPEIVFTLGDIWMVAHIAKSPLRNTFKWVSYFPLDGFPIPKHWIPTIENMDVVITYSKFAKELVEKHVPNKKVEMIYHGVETDLYKPSKDKASLRKYYGLENKFIVGCVARNQQRKNYPALIKAFAKFAENKKDAILYLHTVPFEIWGWDIPELIDRYNLRDKVYMTSGLTLGGTGIDQEMLVNIYNLFDLFVLPTMGEGFGLPILEAQSCGVPVLVTDCSACTELTQGKDELIKVATHHTVSNNIEHAIVDVNDMVDKMNQFYTRRNLLVKYSEAGRKYALNMDWKLMLPKFTEIIENIRSDFDATALEGKLPRFYRL